jgi:chemotaxis signal transduction protein
MRTPSKERPPVGLDYLSSFMRGLHADKQRLAEIQSAYDNLALLGQLLCSGTDISLMREEFKSLARELLEHLAREHQRKAEMNLKSGAGVAIDVLTRNLYERTADIGFLATDADIRAFAGSAHASSAPVLDVQRSAALKARFGEYVEKYSVYHNIILLSPVGEVLLQLDENNPVQHSADPLIQEALSTDAGYVEVFRQTDLLPGEAQPLLYACRVMSEDDSQPVGVLCLCFRFQDECRRIFRNLVADDDWTVITLLDSAGRVIASSDPWHVPIGAPMETALDDDCRTVRFAGREYLASTRPTHGYQGYQGAGWLGHALTPVEYAFESSGAQELENVAGDFLDCVLATTDLLGPELRRIPLDAARIQSDLNRAVWNGRIWLAREPEAAQSAAFAKVLLGEIGSAGVRTRKVFSESINNLYKTVVASSLLDCATRSALAIDLMDRNLYERANDCRWWALTRLFREELIAPDRNDKAQRQRLAGVLGKINSLYTVYTNLVLFDRSGHVLAVSNPAYGDLIGTPLDAPWMRASLGLADSQHYAVSTFSESPLYDGRPSYIFSAAIRSLDEQEVLGGIAVVFDAEPQFRAMLEDTLPRNTDGSFRAGAFAVFADRDGRVIASTAPDLTPGTSLMIGYEFFHMSRGEKRSNVIIYNGRYYAVGSTISTGYREYLADEDAHRNHVVALVFSPLSEGVIDPESLPVSREGTIEDYQRRRGGRGEALDIACFHIGRNWYGIRASDVVEAVDIDRFTPMPGLPGGLCGCLMHDDCAISIVDPGSVLHARSSSDERRRPPVGGNRQILVLQCRDGLRFGILIDQLAPVREVLLSRVEPLPALMNEGNSPIESLVKPSAEDDERRILMILGVERILQRVGCRLPQSEHEWVAALQKAL